MKRNPKDVRNERILIAIVILIEVIFWLKFGYLIPSVGHRF